MSHEISWKHVATIQTGEEKKKKTQPIRDGASYHNNAA